jgi:hypothetical protein
MKAGRRFCEGYVISIGAANKKNPVSNLETGSFIWKLILQVVKRCPLYLPVVLEPNEKAGV